MSEKVNLKKMPNKSELDDSDFAPTDPAHWHFEAPYSNEASSKQVDEMASLFSELTQDGNVRDLNGKFSLQERTGSVDIPGMHDSKIDYRAFTILDTADDAKYPTEEVHVVLGGDDEDKMHVVLKSLGGDRYNGEIAGPTIKENRPIDKKTAMFLTFMAHDELINKNIPEA